MAEHHHGDMDIREHQKTFDGFVRWSIRVGVFAILVLIFMALANH